MREHQIVINLKREQFEEVQRLARLAGSKSVGAYLKDKVLTFLGLDDGEETHDAPTYSPSAQELTEINHEIARMHRELQVFIAESLSNSVYVDDDEEGTGDDMFDQVYAQHQQLQRSLEKDIQDLLAEDDEADTVNSAPVDPYAKKPPPFQPRKQAPANQTPVSQTGNSATIPDAIDPSTYSGVPATGYPTNAAGVYNNVSADSIWLTPPAQALTPGLQPDTTSGGMRNDFGQVNDELEDLAERAFAISPRLGTSDAAPPAATGFRRPLVEDPLSDLIDDHIMEEAQRQRAANVEETNTYDDGVVYAFGSAEEGEVLPQEPYSEDSAVPAQEVQQPVSPAEQPPDMAADQSTDQPDALPKPGSTDQDQSAAAGAQTVSDDQFASQTDETTAPRPDPPTLSGPPPKRRRAPEESAGDDDERLSGGPPPKRRKK